MAFILSDRVKETSITTGTGSIVLGGPFGGFQSFSAAIGNGNSTYYAIENEAQWEVGIGTYSSVSNSISRDTVLASSNGDNRINLNGVSIVFCTYAADRSVYINDKNLIDLRGCSGILFDRSSLLSTGLSVSGESFFQPDVNSKTSLTFIRNSDGNFFHAYVDDSLDRTIGLYTDGQANPTWRLGLKNNPTNVFAAPDYGYIYGRDGIVGLAPNSINKFELTNTAGLSYIHNNTEVLRVTSTTGVYLNSLASTFPALSLNGGPSMTANIQEWKNFGGTILSAVDSQGRFAINRASAVYQLDVAGSGRFNAIVFSDGTVQTTAASGIGGGSQSGISAAYFNLIGLSGVSVIGSPVLNSGSMTVLLSDTAVTSGTYGNITNIPSFTVDRKGRLVAASNVPINYASGVHTHIASDITNFNTAVSGLLSPYALLNSGNFANLFVNTIPVSVSGHTHVAANITDFNVVVSGLVSGIYQPLLSNPITGVGTSGFLPRWISNSGVANSVIYQSGSNIGIGTTSPTRVLDVRGSAFISGALFDIFNSSGASGQVLVSTPNGVAWQNVSVSGGSSSGIAGIGVTNYTTKWSSPNSVTSGIIFDDGTNIGIGTASPTARLHVQNSSAATTGVIIRGASSQSADLFQVQNNANLPLTRIDAAGSISGANDAIFMNRLGIGLIPSYKLHVKGSDSSSTEAISIINSSDKFTYRFLNDGTLSIGNDAQRVTLSPYSSSGGLGSPLALDGDLGLSVESLRTSIGALSGGVFRVTRANSESNTTGSTVFLAVGHKTGNSFSPSGGNATHTMVQLFPTINQIGGANGITRGVYVNPTLTAAADWRSIETANSSGWAIFAQGTAPSYFNGNVGVGVTPSTVRLQVRGFGNSLSSTDTLRIENADGSGIFTIRDNGNTVYGPTTGLNGAIISASDGSDNVSFSAMCGLRFRSSLGATTNGADHFFRNYQGSRTYTSGAGRLLEINGGFNPSGGSSTYEILSVVGAINQIGGANGAVRGIYVNPTLTAVSDYRAIEANNNVGWAFFAQGTAASHFNGNVGIGTTSVAAGPRLFVVNSSATVTGVIVRGAASQSADLLQIQNSAGTTLLDIDAAGSLSGVGSGIFMGRIGIGTSVPQTFIHVSGDAPTVGTLFRLQNNLSSSKTFFDIRIGTAGNFDDHIFFNRNGTNFFGATSAGALYLPNDTRIDAGRQISSNVNSNCFIDLQGTSSSSPSGSTDSTRIGYLNTASFRILSSYNEVLRINGSGDVGIGTTSPTQKLDVRGNVFISGALYDSINSIGTSGQVLVSTPNGIQWQNVSVSGGGGVSSGVTGTGLANYTARWLNASTLTTGILYDNGTNVGVGTDSPSQKLDVRGNAYVSGLLNITSGNFGDAITFHNGYKIRTFAGGGLEILSAPYTRIGNTGGTQVANFTAGTNVGAGLNITPIASQTGLVITGAAGQSADLLQIQNNTGITLFDIDAAGSISGVGSGIFMQRVGIGTANPSSALSIGSANNFTVDSIGNVNLVSPANLQVNRTNDAIGNTAINFANVFGLQITATNNDFQINRRAASVWSNAVSVTNASGFVGIGTANPQYLLDVRGSAFISGALFDSKNSIGTSGQVLVSTPNGIEWQNVSVSGGSSSGIFGTGSANYLARWTTASSLGTGIVFDNGTNVGVGTASPSQKLHVNGNILLDQSIFTTQSNAQFLTTGSFALPIKVGSLTISSTYGGVEAPLSGLYVQGNAGIGTTSPVAKLHIQTGAATTTGVIVRGAAAQSADLQQWQNNAGSSLVNIDAAGSINTVSQVLASGLTLRSSDINTETSLTFLNTGAGNISFRNFYQRNPNIALHWQYNNQGSITGLMQLSNTGDLSISGALLFGGDLNIGSRFINGQNSSSIRIYDASDGNLKITAAAFNNAISTIRFFTGSPATERLRINEVGNIGINTASPRSLLHATTTSSTNSGIILTSSAGQSADLLQIQNSAGAALVRVDAAGSISGVASGIFMQRVGVGVANPTQQIDVSGNIRVRGGYIDANGSSGFNGDLLTSNGSLAYWQTPTIYLTPPGGSTGNIQFKGSENDFDGTNDLQWDFINNRLGIGTINPTQRLHVSGNVRLAGAIFDNLNLPGTSGQVLVSTSGGVEWRTFTGGGSGISGNGAANKIAFFDTSTTLSNDTNLHWDSINDRLGVGTSAPSTTLDVAGTGYFLQSVRTSGTVVFASGNTGSVGVMQWDNGEGTVTLGAKGGNVTVNLGQDNIVLCNNGAGVSLTKGQVVYASGAQGQRPLVNLALATSDLTSARTIGVVDETITNGSEGFVSTFGVVTNLNTSALTAGSGLWLSATTPGEITMTRPVAPNHGVFIGWCLNSHPSAGRIFVDVQNGHELDELHDVLVQNPVSGQLLQYDSSLGIWRNATVSFGGGGGSGISNEDSIINALIFG